eukprot:2935342-Prymnesium_polylepis.1
MCVDTNVLVYTAAVGSHCLTMLQAYHLPGDMCRLVLMERRAFLCAGSIINFPQTSLAYVTRPRVSTASILWPPVSMNINGRQRGGRPGGDDGDGRECANGSTRQAARA